MADSPAGKVTDSLNLRQMTAKRISWEGWSLRIVDPRKGEVTNKRYGFEKDEHRYVVTVATVGGPIVLGAVMAYILEEPKQPFRADGGMAEIKGTTEQDTDEGCPCEMYEFPCWPCYRDDRRDLPEEDE